MINANGNGIYFYGVYIDMVLLLVVGLIIIFVIVFLIIKSRRDRYNEFVVAIENGQKYVEEKQSLKLNSSKFSDDNPVKSLSIENDILMDDFRQSATELLETARDEESFEQIASTLIEENNNIVDEFELSSEQLELLDMFEDKFKDNQMINDSTDDVMDDITNQMFDSLNSIENEHKEFETKKSDDIFVSSIGYRNELNPIESSSIETQDLIEQSFDDLLNLNESEITRGSLDSLLIDSDDNQESVNTFLSNDNETQIQESIDILDSFKEVLEEPPSSYTIDEEEPHTAKEIEQFFELEKDEPLSFEQSNSTIADLKYGTDGNLHLSINKQNEIFDQDSVHEQIEDSKDVLVNIEPDTIDKHPENEIDSILNSLNKSNQDNKIGRRTRKDVYEIIENHRKDVERRELSEFEQFEERNSVISYNELLDKISSERVGNSGYQKVNLVLNSDDQISIKKNIEKLEGTTSIDNSDHVYKPYVPISPVFGMNGRVEEPFIDDDLSFDQEINDDQIENEVVEPVRFGSPSIVEDATIPEPRRKPNPLYSEKLYKYNEKRQKIDKIYDSISLEKETVNNEQKNTKNSVKSDDTLDGSISFLNQLKSYRNEL